MMYDKWSSTYGMRDLLDRFGAAAAGGGFGLPARLPAGVPLGDLCPGGLSLSFFLIVVPPSDISCPEPAVPAPSPSEPDPAPMWLRFLGAG